MRRPAAGDRVTNETRRIAMRQHREPTDLHTDTPDLAAALRQALVAAIGKRRLASLLDPPTGYQPSSAPAGGRHPEKHHSWLRTASHAAVYTAAGLHLLQRRSHRAH
jgi:hypothetical protein